jgi:hypothetical protein
MFGLKKKKVTSNIDIGSEVWFCCSNYYEPEIISGIVQKIYASKSRGNISLEVLNKKGSEYSGDKGAFFKSKNECIDHWVNYLGSMRDRE